VSFVINIVIIHLGLVHLFLEKKSCFFLLCKDYDQGHTPENELQIYTWIDATLGKLTQLIKEVTPDTRRRGTQFDFSIVTADESQNCYYLKDIGKTENGQQRTDDQIQLPHKRFHLGDYLDVAINHKRQEQTALSVNSRRDRITQQPSEENNNNTRRGGGGSGPGRSIQRNVHRDRPY
jgi:hypothetical protein